MYCMFSKVQRLVRSLIPIDFQAVKLPTVISTFERSKFDLIKFLFVSSLQLLRWVFHHLWNDTILRWENAQGNCLTHRALIIICVLMQV